MWDALGSIGIGVLLVLVAFFVGIEVKALLIGQGVEPRTRERMLAFLKECSEIEQVFSLLTLQMGNDVMVAIKARMREKDSAEALIAVINSCEAAFREAFPQTMWLFFEPDDKD